MLYCESRKEILLAEPRQLNLMKLSQKFKQDLDVVEAALLCCREILDKKDKEAEDAEWLENWSRWVD